jgi:hypothetical protein
VEEDESMLTLLKAKLATLIQTKVGVAVLAAVLVAGGGGAVAMASTHGNLGAVGSSLAHTTATPGHGDSTETSDGDTGNANRLSVEGTLKAYTAAAGSTPASISVTDQHATSYSIVVNANTKVNGVHASSLNDLKNAVGHKVQVQATKQSGKWVASKVTVEEASDSQGDDQGEGQEGTQLAGRVASVAGSSFMLTDQRGTTKVVVNGSTRYVGLSGLSGLRAGAYVLVTGSKQSDGSVLASLVVSSGHEGDGGGNGTPTPDATRSE